MNSPKDNYNMKERKEKPMIWLLNIQLKTLKQTTQSNTLFHSIFSLKLKKNTPPQLLQSIPNS